jgi:hypothetical protein
MTSCGDGVTWASPTVVVLDMESRSLLVGFLARSVFEHRSGRCF